MSTEPIEQTPQSVQERLRSNRRGIQEKTSVTLEIPGYGGLFARYRLLDFRESRAIGTEVTHAGVKGEVDRELYLAAHHLIAASIGVEAHIDGVTHDLGLTLGRDLAAYLGVAELEDGEPIEFENDRQAVLAIFRRQVDIVAAHAKLSSETAYTDREADKTLLGESGAAGE